MKILSEIIEQIKTDNANKDASLPDVLDAQLEKLLLDLTQKTDEINAAFISSIDGVARAEKTASDFDKHRFSAMGSALLALSDNLLREGEKGVTQNVLLEGSEGHVFVMHAGKNLLLTVFTVKGSNLGLPLAHAKQTAEIIATLESSL